MTGRRRSLFDRNALWLLATPTALVLLAISFTLLLAVALVVVGARLYVVTNQRDEASAEYAELLFEHAGCPAPVQSVVFVELQAVDRFSPAMEDAARALPAMQERLRRRSGLPSQREAGDLS